MGTDSILFFQKWFPSRPFSPGPRGPHDRMISARKPWPGGSHLVGEPFRAHPKLYCLEHSPSCMLR